MILTDDELDSSGIPTRRTGYIAMYKVENVTVSNATLEFDFVERLENFKLGPRASCDVNDDIFRAAISVV